MVAVVEPDPLYAETLVSVVGSVSGVYDDLDALRRDLDDSVDVVLVGPRVPAAQVFAFAEAVRTTRPTLGIVLVRQRVDTAVLADALRAGIRDVVKERDHAAIGDAVSRALELARAVREQSGMSVPVTEEKQSGRLITVFSAKGGCGKTTLATNLAVALADNGRRSVCLVDLDLAFGDVAIALQLFPAHTLGDAVPLGESLDDAAVQALLTPHSPGLMTLVAPVEPGAAESIPAGLVQRILKILKHRYSFVVVDTPPAFTDHVLAAFDESDLVALLATLDIPALKNLKLTLETLDLLNYPRERWRIVLNRADSKVGLQVAEVEKALRVPISIQIPSSRSIPASINRGVPIVLDEPTHPVSVAIREFAAACAAGVPGHLPTSVPRTDQRRFSLRRRMERS